MKHVAVILAGGIGKRMDSSMPKQFLEIKGKPIIAHTIENFQKCRDIDNILIVCVKEWKEYLDDIVEKYELSKVSWIVEGGNTVHDSTRNAVFFLKDYISDDDYVIIHDAARPILPQVAIKTMLDIAHENGNASLAIPSHETLIYTDDQISGNSQLDRSKVMRVQTPQTYVFSQIYSLYQRAEADNIHDIIYADLVAIHYGERVFFSKGFTNNIKITRKEDIPLCESLMDFSEVELFSE